ncbi:MAG TPA: hypothetical protein VFE51_29545 [Verrucomicrobiae bacterium]|nr:hypothetical protein [Verrucomicrobiae bacterium]
MTRLIAALMILGVLFAGWELFFYWEKVKNEEETQKKQAAAAIVVGDQLSGMPQQLEPALKAAEAQGATGLRNFLKFYGRSLQDPRKAWIELDYCLLIVRDDPSEAKRLFAEVKNRTPESSPVWPRIRKLEKAYE